MNGTGNKLTNPRKKKKNSFFIFILILDTYIHTYTLFIVISLGVFMVLRKQGPLTY